MKIFTAGSVWRIHVAAALIGLSFLSLSTQTAAENATTAVTKSPEVDELDKLINQINKLSEEAKYQEAISLAINVLDTREKAQGPDTLDVAASLQTLGQLYQATGDYVKAESSHQRSLAIREKRLGPQHANVGYSLNDLALLYQTIGDYGQAGPLYERSLAILEKALGSEHEDVAAVLNNLALFYVQKGEYTKAEPLYLRGLAAQEKRFGPEHPNVAFPLLNLADLYRQRGDYKLAEGLLNRSLAIREKAYGEAHPDTAFSLNNLAMLYYSMGEYKRAEKAFERSLAIREKVFGPEHSQVADSLSNLALVNNEEANYARSELLFERSLAIREKIVGPNHPSLGVTLNLLAAVCREKADYAKAETLYLRSLSIAQASGDPNHTNIAMVHTNLGNLYEAKGDYLEAGKHYEKSVEIWKNAFGDENPQMAVVLANLGDLDRRQGNYLRAEARLQQSIALFEKAMGTDHPNVAKALNTLALTYQAKGNYVQAEHLYQRSLEISRKRLGSQHPNFATALSNLANLYQDKGNYAKARALQLKSLAILEKTLGPLHPKVGNALIGLGTTAWSQKNIPQATALLDRAMEIEERNLSAILATSADDKKRAYMATLVESTDKIISLHLRGAANDRVSGHLALTTVLRRKGRVLDSVAEGMTTLRLHMNAEDRELLDQLFDVRAHLAKLILKVQDKNVDQYHAQIISLEKQQQVLETKISARSTEFRNQTQAVTVERVQQTLPSDAALVEWVIYRPFSPGSNGENAKRRYAAALLHRQGEPVWMDLGDVDTIDKTIAAFRTALGNPHSTDAERLARRLDEQLMQPIRKHLGAAKLVLVSPDGALNLAPIGAFRDETNHYLVERFTISYLTTGRDLLRLQIKNPTSQPSVVIAAPDFDDVAKPALVATANTQSNRIRRSVDFSTEHFNPLPGTLVEARAINSIVPGIQVVSGADASKSALEQLRGPAILHIATHGFFLPDFDSNDGKLESKNPLLRSGLALAGANKLASGEGQGVLTALEAAGLDLWGTRLVVLSACETGIGEVQNGDGVYGLRRALVIAGSESQVMSLWKVDDEATRELMVDYYRRLVRSEGRAEALRNAQLHILRRQPFSHPYYWAGFIPAGAWEGVSGLVE